MNGPIVVPADTFRPRTRLAMVLERLAAESGQPAAAILQHVGHCRFKDLMLRLCRSVMFTDWQVLDGETGKWGPADRDYLDGQWATYSAALLEDFGQHVACPNCDKPCHPADADGSFQPVESREGD